MAQSTNTSWKHKAKRVFSILTIFIIALDFLVQTNPSTISCFASGKLAASRYRLCTAALDEPLATGRLRLLLRHHQVFAADVRLKPEAVLPLADALIAEGKAYDFVRFVRGKALAKMKQPQKALQEFEALNKKHPDHPWYAYATGMAQIDVQHFDDAVATANAFIKHHPKSSAGKALLGWAAFNQGRTTEAIVHLETATALKPADSMPHYFLSIALAAAGQPDRAKAESDLARQQSRQLRSPEDV